jgi:hypothetical protein
VPIASKKFASTRVKTSSATVITSSRANAPRETSPTSERSGTPATRSGSAGTDSDQPFGFVPFDGPTCATASTAMAIIVVITTPIRIPARTSRATSSPVISRPTVNTAVGQEAIEPPMPSPTGTVVFAASASRRTKPASTRPMKAMNSPMPTAIAAFSSAGTALNTAEHQRHHPGHQGCHRSHLRHRQHLPEHVGLGARPVGGEAAEDQRVQHDDVGHRRERDEAAAQLAADRRAPLRDAEESLDHGWGD